MKKIFLMLIMALPFSAMAQPGMTPEQQEQFRKQMDEFQKQMDQEMQALRDSLSKMNDMMQNQDWSQFDTMSFKMEDFPEIPEMPEMPEAPVPPGGDVDSYDDSTTVRFGKWNVVVHEGDGDDHVQVYKEDWCGDCDGNELKDIETKFLLLDIGVNNYFAKGFQSDLASQYDPMEPNPGKSWVVNIHAVNQRVNLINYHLWLSYGIFFEFNSYKYNSDLVLQPRVDSVSFVASDVPLKKNKLSCEYLGIPLMLRYETNPSDIDESFHFSAGGFGEYLIGAHTKIKTNDNTKLKAHDDFNLNRFRYGIVVRAGYGWVNVFGNFALSELLHGNLEPVVYPFSAGLALEF